MKRVLVAAAVGGLVSGVPSTVAAVVAGRDPLEATLAAGSLLLPRETRRLRLAAAAVPVHAVVSLFWTLVLDRTLPRRRPVPWGAAAGAAIAALDLVVVGRRLPRVRGLPFLPQLADHVAFGAVVGALVRKGAG
jgi:hypothetical protein